MGGSAKPPSGRDRPGAHRARSPIGGILAPGAARPAYAPRPPEPAAPRWWTGPASTRARRLPAARDRRAAR